MPITASEQATHTQPSHLIRGLGLWSATAIVIGDTIGTGIFLVSSDMARAVGSVKLVFAAWIIGGIIVLFGAFCYAELGAAFPKAGGPYVYLNRGLNPLLGFLFGWMSSFLERPVGMATLAAGFLRFVGFLFPVVATPLFSWHIGSYEFVCSAEQPLAALVVVAVTAINYLSVRIGGSIQVLMTSLKMGTILAIVVAGGLFAKPHAIAAVAPASPMGWGTIGAILTALVPAMWAYNGFNDLGDLGEEIVRPERNIPRAIILGLLTVCGLYLLANMVYFHVLPLAELTRSHHLASDVVQALAGSRGATWITIAMAISALGALHVVVLTGARIPYAMARDGAFFEFAARLHPTFRTPSGSLIFLGALAALLAFTGTYEELYSLFVFGVWIFFALSAMALLRLRKTEPDLPRPYRAWGYPLTPLIFLAAAVALTVNLWMVRPVRSSLGLAVILAGIPFFYHWRKAHRTTSEFPDKAGIFLVLFFASAFATGVAHAQETKTLAERLGYAKDAKLLIVHDDDLGASHSVNAAAIAALESGAVNSASIMVPCPWFPEIADYAKTHPDTDFGLHLTMTSERVYVKWGPVGSRDTVPSLVDANGYLRQDWPADVKINAQDAEREMRAQVEKALAMGVRPTHLDSHQYRLFENGKEIFEAALRVAHDYKLPLLIPKEWADEYPYLKSSAGPNDISPDHVVSIEANVPAAGWNDFYVTALKHLQPGVTEFIVHLAYDNEEMRAMTRERDSWGAAWRQRDFNFFTSAEFRKLLAEENIKLVTWRELGKLAASKN